MFYCTPKGTLTAYKTKNKKNKNTNISRLFGRAGGPSQDSLKRGKHLGKTTKNKKNNISILFGKGGVPNNNLSFMLCPR